MPFYMYFCCCRIIKRKSPLPQGKGEPLQTTCILSYAPKITDGHRRGLLVFALRLGSDVHKKTDTGLAPPPVRYFLRNSFATVSVKAFIIHLCRKYSTAYDLCQEGDLIGIACDSKALQSNGNFRIANDYRLREH